MLTITVPTCEMFDDSKGCFVYVKEQTLKLEHSLVSISKWESKWHKPFLTKDLKTFEETIDYVKCMTLTHNVNPNIYMALTDENLKEINEYIGDPMTATWFSNKDRSGQSREQITSELIYYWMIAMNIPFECQKWHLNRLITLVRVCEIKNQPPKKRSEREILAERMAINEARKKQLNTKG